MIGVGQIKFAAKLIRIGKRHRWIRISFLVLVGGLGYLSVLYIFRASSLGSQRTESRPFVPYYIVLSSIDHSTKTLNLDVEVFGPIGKESVVDCLDISDDYSASIRKVTLAPYGSTAKNTIYRGSTKFEYDTDLRQFPFDEIPLAISFPTDCFELKLDRIEAPVYVENKIKEYELVEKGPYSSSGPGSRVSLRRNAFLIYLTEFVFIVAFASAIMLIVNAGEKLPDLSLLTYFVGLWAIRSILLSPVQGMTVFPTVVELTIIFLFCFTIFGISATRLIARYSAKTESRLAKEDLGD